MTAAAAPVTPRRTCPGCQSAMQPFFAGGGQAEIDRCQFCGGYWLDGGELEQVLGHELAHELLDGAATSRRCAGCQLTLQPVLIRGTPVERCSLCHSFYLDEGELAELAGREVKLSATGAWLPPGREAITFRCAGCGDDRDLDEGFPTGKGMACRNCVGMLDATPSTLAPSRRRFGDLLDPGIDVVTARGVGSLLSLAWRLFR